MPIVLAIEPDRRQAAHLLAIVRHQVSAELILADTTEGALDAIGNRVPDLVLVPALLSPQDDAALAAALRVIAAAAHVRTLTIPVLASGVKRTPDGGILARWRRGRTAAPEPDGCQPSVFGEQISAYLEEAAAERAQLEEDALLEVEPDPVVESPLAAGTELRHHTPTNNSDTGGGGQPLHLWEGDPIAESAIEEEEEEEEEPTIDLSGELQGLTDDVEDALFDGERVGVYTITADADEAAADAFDLLPSILEPAAIVEPVVEAKPEPAPAEPLFVEPPEPPRSDIEPWVPMYLTPGRLWPALEGMPAEVPVARAEQPDWIELVASLRQDLERRRTDQASAADPIAARPSDGAHADAHPLVKKPRTQPRKAKPIQDEWGFFDPEQCGFSTLLAKLEEITEDGPGV